MGKLDVKSRREALSNLLRKLDRAIGEAPKGLTAEELNSCWIIALRQWTKN